ncbi:MAG TPA: Hpt domain-containing protein, partial [Cellvibrionaceae bacterium]|nr:Hpt domain-containing protein [Cellvibrionaceae bacterium]
MAVDLSQFRQVFIEESFEGLDSMEAALMALNINAIDSETINAIFRAAHSIKGGSATFGYSAIAGFTHVLETLLDQVRSGQRSLDANSVNLLLKSVDAMRDMLALLQTEQNCYTDSALALKAEFEALLQIPIAQSALAEKPLDRPEQKKPLNESVKAVEPILAGWKIEFLPGRDLFASGNCPVNILRELSQLGTVLIQPVLTAVPDIKNINPEECYLGWQISLASPCQAEEIAAVFGWVEDQAVIRIEPVYDSARNDLPATHKNRYGGWHIHFKPKPELLHSGNDPLRIFRALQELGYCEISLGDNIELPDFHSYDSQLLYVHWQINCYGDLGYEAIASAFDWVMGDCDLTITAIEPTEEIANETAEQPALTQVKKLAAALATSAPVEPMANNVVPFITPAPAVVTPPQQAPAVAEANKKTASAETSSIRVGIDKIDSLINMVGELVITQSMLGQLGSELNLAAAPKLMEGLSQLAQNTRELQESVMRIRMLPISFAFSRFPRMVRDLGQTLGKKIHIELNGENTELDKTVMEKIGDPLVHLVRNAVDHGIELPEVRLA